MSLEWREIHPGLMLAEPTTMISLSLAKAKLNDRSQYQMELILNSSGSHLRHTYLFGEQDLKVDDWDHAKEYARSLAVVSLSGIAAAARDGLSRLEARP